MCWRSLRWWPRFVNELPDAIAFARAAYYLMGKSFARLDYFESMPMQKFMTLVAIRQQEVERENKEIERARKKK